MLFNSLEFAVFLPIVFLLYWFVTKNSIKQQNILLLIASYIFYGWWDWRFLGLIAFSSFVDFSIGKKLGKTSNERSRKGLLYSSLFVNLGLLGLFKYYNFFAQSFADAFTLLGSSIHVDRLNIVLPVGISFYTFQTLSYTIDVYKKKLEPTENSIDFFAFVSFFPQLVAGPIERATHLLPQFQKRRYFEYVKAVDGMRQILWGLFKKVVIADNCAYYANLVFNNYEDYNGSSLLLGAIFFSFQIYGDFSGYSDIAIGTARLFGFDLMQNFAFPYFSRDIAEFWRRWHISLSTWFRDYLYIPLGGSKGGTWMKVRNTFIIFLVSGFWHGANWTFIAWGALNAIYFLPLLLLKQNRNNIEIVAKNRLLPNIKELFQMATTYFMVVIAWIFFRAESINHAIHYLYNMVIGLKLKKGYVESLNFLYWEIGIAFLLVQTLFIIIEWIGRENKYALQNIGLNRITRWSLYISIGIGIAVFGNFSETEFIYFAF
ncbi:MBOAT family protein [Flammeovirga sp. EKP202]|uniref:MBOAT family O-acyltransferase n=1 Tax=Flammeovirga sp. EKP202 TaxID=2770592 RepID=UPI00165FFB52|nr:MBOAT family protein [Flammeovirga sp. EKP202]MBD0400815.1 MBOAT family protein [Flammeovirga sp. EKP202]